MHARGNSRRHPGNAGFLLALGALLIPVAGCRTCTDEPPALPAPIQTGATGASNAVPLRVDVAVRVSVRRPIAAVTFKNHSDKEVALISWQACAGGVIENDVFRIVGPKGNVPYIGVLKSRRPPTAADLIHVPAGQDWSVEVALDSAYALGAPGRYEATYDAYHQPPALGVHLTSAPAFFELP